MATATLYLNITIDVELGNTTDLDQALEQAKSFAIKDILKQGIQWSDGEKPKVVGVYTGHDFEGD